MEFLLFAIVGLVAIGAAVAMLLSENAIYSAMFLIVNFISVAVLYIMLDAPFLAMVQVAVYAGAIMVLFLFVIMLLGAEKPTDVNVRRFVWLPALAGGLGLVFLLAVGGAISSAQIDTLEPPPAEVVFTLVHAAPADAEIPENGNDAQIAIAERRFDVYIDDELFLEDLTFNDTREENQRAVLLEAGEHTITFNASGTELPLVTETLVLEPTADTVVGVLYGEEVSGLQFAAVNQELSTPSAQAGRISVFNALTQTETIEVVSLESELFAPNQDGTGRKVTSLLGEIPVGTSSETIVYPPAVSQLSHFIIEGGRAESLEQQGTDSSAILVSLNNYPLSIERETAYMVVVAPNRAFGSEMNTALISRAAVATAGFGSPIAVGSVLFTDYVLPLQIVALLLLAAMVGVIVLTLRGEHEPKPSRMTRRKVSRPLTSVIASQTGSNIEAGLPQIAPPSNDEDQPEPAGAEE